VCSPTPDAEKRAECERPRRERRLMLEAASLSVEDVAAIAEELRA